MKTILLAFLLLLFNLVSKGQLVGFDKQFIRNEITNQKIDSSTATDGTHYIFYTQTDRGHSSVIAYYFNSSGVSIYEKIVPGDTEELNDWVVLFNKEAVPLSDKEWREYLSSKR